MSGEATESSLFCGSVFHVLSLTRVISAPACIFYAIVSPIPDFCIPKSTEYLVLPPVFSNYRPGKSQRALQMALNCAFPEWQLVDQTEQLSVEGILQPCVLIYMSNLQTLGDLFWPFGWYWLNYMYVFIFEELKNGRERVRSYVFHFLRLGQWWEAVKQWKLMNFTLYLNREIYEHIDDFFSF